MPRAKRSKPNTPTQLEKASSMNTTTTTRCGQFNCTRLKLLRFPDGSKYTESVRAEFFTLEEFFASMLDKVPFHLLLQNIGAWAGNDGSVAGRVTLGELLKLDQPDPTAMYCGASAYYRAMTTQRLRPECVTSRALLKIKLQEWQAKQQADSTQREAEAAAHAAAHGFEPTKSHTGRRVWKKSCYTLHPRAQNGWEVSVRGYCCAQGATAQEALEKFATRKS